MLHSQLTPNERLLIYDSVKAYQGSLLSNMNLKMRLNFSQKTYATKLIDWVRDELVFDAPLDQLDWVLLNKGTRVTITFITKLAIFTAEVEIVSSHKKNGAISYTSKLLTPLIREQQRDSFRLDVLLDLTYQLLPEEDKEYILSALPHYKGTILNLSMGGMCMISSKRLPKGSHLKLKFELVNTELLLTGEVLYIGEKNATGSYTHRIKFIYLELQDENILNRLIFEKQRQLIKHPKF